MSDECAYRRGGIWLLIYVDDIIIAGNSLPEIEQFKKDLPNHVEVKEMGQLRSFLGVNFNRYANGACITQTHYVK